MPTYQYRCKSCKHEFEEFQKMSDSLLVVCPSCKKHTLVRVFGGGTGLVFKGSGFYITDYKGKSPSSSHNKETKTETKSETKTETKTETKPKAPSKSQDSSKPSDSSAKKD